MSLNDLEHQNKGFYGFLAILGCKTFQERIVPKSIETGKDKACIKEQLL